MNEREPAVIESSAPTRVDLAGGTIDIPPIYLFHEGASTVNFAVSLRAHCRIVPTDRPVIKIRSVDRNEGFEIPLSEIGTLKAESRLKLLSKLIYFFKPETGFEMTTISEAPAGAGLAGSSTLAIACIGALNRLVGDRYSPDEFIPIAANIETQVIEVPAGYQDYYSAQYGGLACIHFRPDGIVREPLPSEADELEQRIAVIYTGEPRNSGTNNWEITKAHVDGDQQIFDIFEEIRDGSVALRSALLADDWKSVGAILKAAHPVRKMLSPRITTDRMDSLIETAESAGAIAAKVCGAGGGGCMAFFCEKGGRQDIESALAATDGVEILDWHFDSVGLDVKERKPETV